MAIDLGLKKVCKVSAILILTLPLTMKAATAAVSVNRSNNELGFKLISEASQLDTTQKNRFISPLSAHLALSMALNGAANKTKEQLLSVLGYSVDDSLDEINQQNVALVQSLVKAPLTEEEKAVRPQWLGQPTVFSVKNSAWSTNGGDRPRERYDFSNIFVKDLETFYQVATPISLDFKASGSEKVINDWTKEATRGLVPKIIDGDTLSELLWILLNTTYLEAQWTRPFQKVAAPVMFQRLNGPSIRVATMVQQAQSMMAQFNGLTVAELALNDSTMKAYLVVPDAVDGFKKLQSGASKIWTSQFWETAFDKLQPVYLRIEMPAFKVTDEVLLLKDKELTKKVGLNFLYQDWTDLTRMDGAGSPPSKVAIIKQNTKVDWSEKGITAAAATIVGGSERTSAPRPGKLTVDRPFYFAIYDQNTKAFLFLGQVVDPTVQ